MIELAIPGRETFRLEHLVLDVNGTLALDGILLPGVTERLATLRQALALHLLTADTHGAQQRINQALRLEGRRLDPAAAGAEQKAAYVRTLGADRVVAIGNGVNDVGMLRDAALGIAVLGPEGMALVALQAADVVTRSIADALDLLSNPKRLVATLRW